MVVAGAGMPENRRAPDDDAGRMAALRRRRPRRACPAAGRAVAGAGRAAPPCTTKRGSPTTPSWSSWPPRQSPDARQGALLTMLNQREISARRGLIVSGDAATGKSTG